jgi:hypothetical protein
MSTKKLLPMLLLLSAGGGLRWDVMLSGALSLGLAESWLDAEELSRLVQVELFTWESAGEITQVTGKTITIRRMLGTSDSSWSLEPGAISEMSQLQNGDQVLAKGKTRPDGTFETRKVYMISPSLSRQQVGSGKGAEQTVDHGVPESRVPTMVTDPAGTHPESRGREGYPGPGNPLPVPTGPGGNRGPVGGLQNSRAAGLPRFLAGDAEGTVERIDSHTIVLSQSFFVGSETIIRNLSGRTLKLKDLKPGQRIAVTVEDELDSKTQAIKATVVRLLTP